MKTKATKKKRTSARKASVNQVLALIERYRENLTAAGIEQRPERLPPQSQRALATLEKKLAFPLPPPVRAFLLRGLDGCAGSFGDGEDFATFGFDFMTAPKIVENTVLMRKSAADFCPPDDASRLLVERGIVLTFSEPHLLVTHDGVFHFSFRNPIAKVCDDFASFLIAWTASGCFSSHNFNAHWKQVGPFVTLPISPAKNEWVQCYGAQFPQWAFKSARR